jgi:coenzyme F420-reducing hydrogenase delta subunit
MCSGRVDLEFIFRSFSNGQDGVLVGGCRLNDCNYVTHGNYDALGNAYISWNIMESIGLNPERLSIEFMSGGEGNLLADAVNRFTKKIKELGPIGEAEGLDKNKLRQDLDAVRKLIPFIRLVEREKLRVPERSEEGYRTFYESDEVKRLFDELIGGNLAVSRIVSLLREKPLTTAEISEVLGLNASEVAKYMNNSSRQGLVKYDLDSKSYSLAAGSTRE